MDTLLFEDKLKLEELKKIKQYNKRYIEFITSNSRQAKVEINELIKEGILEGPVKLKKKIE